MATQPEFCVTRGHSKHWIEIEHALRFCRRCQRDVDPALLSSAVLSKQRTYLRQTREEIANQSRELRTLLQRVKEMEERIKTAQQAEFEKINKLRDHMLTKRKREIEFLDD